MSAWAPVLDFAPKKRFQTHMAVSLVNDGPVTIWVESP